MKSIYLSVILSFTSSILVGQDTTIHTLSDVIIRVSPTNNLSITDSMYQFKIVAGKKVEVVSLNTMNSDLSTNNYRQIFKRTPGIYVSEHDASGLQTSISSRGLSANRSWEFNMRQNGYDIAADPSGYPEAYYTPTLDAVSKIEVFRGSSALQYGTQFGGMINYVFKDNLNDKPIGFENTQTIGSFGLFNSYSAIGGKKNKWSYYGFVHHRNADGFRQNSSYKTQNYYGKITREMKKGKVSGEFSNSYYLSQQPGGIVDNLLINHADTSFRSRNWFELAWNIASLQAEFNLSNTLKVNGYLAYTFADRNSVGFLKSISIPDTIDKSTGLYNPRQVDIDQYKTLSSEIRFNQSYQLAGKTQTLTGGVRFCQSDIFRKQQGIGTGTTPFDLTVTNGIFPKDFTLGTQNAAVFAENLFRMGKRFSVSPGFRIESTIATMEGRNSSVVGGILNPAQKKRLIFLGGVSSSYWLMQKSKSKLNVYANATQNYRPVLYSELIPSSTTEIVDPNLKDVRGFTSEAGIKGNVVMKHSRLTYDVNGFYISYKDKIGTASVNSTMLKTNIGDVESKGVELFGEWTILNPFLKESFLNEQLSFFVSGTFQHASYIRWENPAIAGDIKTSILGKNVEYVPNNIIRTGFYYELNGIFLNYQFSYTGEVYTDPTNTIEADKDAKVGLLNAYSIHDISVGYQIAKGYALKFGVNNLLNEMYATRRSNGFPGPGLLPSQGRSFFGTLSIKI
jgi:Fe(3+) dicitrate transport protein